MITYDEALIFTSTFTTAKLIEMINIKLMKDFCSYILCSGCVHIYQSDKWSCGYRNIQMLCTSLLKTPNYNKLLLQNNKKFDIIDIQNCIEIAWREGFDEDGRNHFNSHLTGTKSWIGATEAAVFFRYC
jgi:hypothetical protein